MEFTQLTVGRDVGVLDGLPVDGIVVGVWLGTLVGFRWRESLD